MKTNKPALCLLCLLLFMLPVDLRKINVNSTSQDDGLFPLNMQNDSVDDRYYTCEKEMEKKVNNKYFKKENKSQPFQDAWKKAKRCTERDLKSKDKEDEALTENHLRAICVYTDDGTGFYGKFNEAVRTGRKGYGSSFPFHFLHFWLTRAVQILRKNQICHKTYRRTTVEFSGEVGKEIRFGTFTSTSKLTNLTDFGNKTCFEILTCAGAFLKKYPQFGDSEQEVLIPPYEKFKIIQKHEKKKCENEKCKRSDNLPDCKTVYVLESTGVQSELNCQLAKRKIM